MFTKKWAYDIILERKNISLSKALLVAIRTKGFIALATATSCSSLQYFREDLRTHSRFKIPIDIDENFTCNISKQSSLVTLIRDSKLIVWDEVSMAKKLSSS
ncbi:hypothetical protein H5410_049432 [Solanum commersonii]|uniref:ATP-dependent DNA helicase n=1 Tax=Solanum commersonii TaxID=4109 RepID=A0A9J5WU55_SOLCO|nr:hypothetical protein H5410_049432 [Solanum commersonii]